MLEMTKFVIYLVCFSIVVRDNNIIVSASARKDENGNDYYDYPSPTDKNPVQIQTRDLPHYDHVQHFCINSTIKVYDCPLITCTSNGPTLASRFCATYNEDKRSLSIASCPYFQPRANGFKKPRYGKIIIELPNNLSQLNDYMCGPLNRKGLVCSECADGFGPSVTSFGYRCVNCTDAWYGVPLFLVLEFAPVTVFYLVILVFQISATSAPMQCFILYAQSVVVAFYLSIYENNSLRDAIFTERGHLRLDMQIIHVMYGVFNLDFFQFLKPSVCINSQLNSIHVAFLGYISVMYPIILIILTWICVELHGRNFRPLVWLWRPFHKCFVRLRRGWDAKSDIIDVFATFFLLSYSKCAYQTILLLSNQDIRSYNETGNCSEVHHHAVVDLNVQVGSKEHLVFMIPAVMIFLVYNILPPLLLIFHPFKAFRTCLSRCHLDIIAVNIFVEKLNSCYRNGLDGGRDMRSWCGLYFFLRMIVYVVGIVSYGLLRGYTENVWILNEIWFPCGTVFMLTALTIALVKPYQKPYMSYIDSFLLSNLALCCFVATSKVFTFLMIKILFAIPVLALILTLLLRKARWASTFLKNLSQRCCRCKLKLEIRQSKTLGFAKNFNGETIEEQLPFIHSAIISTEVNSYGTY